MSMLLECTKLVKQFGKKTVLQDIDLKLESGRIIGLLGPNGSGKTTLLKVINGLLTPTSGKITFCGEKIGVESKKHISYLPDQTYLNMNQQVIDVIHLFRDFYEDFEEERAYDMLKKLEIYPQEYIKTLSKGTKEKMQLVLVMSRRAKLYILDEPIAGVDPAARDYILRTIIANYDSEASIVISTHLIAEIENVLDEAVFIKEGKIINHALVDEVRMKEGKSIDELFREVFRCQENI